MNEATIKISQNMQGIAKILDDVITDVAGERTCDVLSAPPTGGAGGGPVDIYWEYQAGRPAHKFTRAIKCF